MSEKIKVRKADKKDNRDPMADMNIYLDEGVRSTRKDKRKNNPKNSWRYEENDDE
jgi:hypothetical protein